MSIESQIMLAAARQSGRHASPERYCINGIYLTENDISQSFKHLLKDLEVRLLVLFVTIITKLDWNGQRSLNMFLMLLPPPHTSKPRSEGRQIADYFISHPAAQTVYWSGTNVCAKISSKPLLILTCSWTRLTYKA